VYGYSDGVAPWLYQLDDGSHEALTVLPGKPCRVIKDSQGLKDGKHQVVVTPQSSSFVLTKFTYVLFTLVFHDLFLSVPSVLKLEVYCQTPPGQTPPERTPRIHQARIFLDRALLA